eukprot:TRINITY_DN73984_c0_g1_i1.p1 TRINITY_DN73984_c0_g1~~TRINITY_DN73984_c0_g1_i1.p1  ORF type:complete len:565 (+),score=76.19 TRINITY_DN73984_c0_g1_i1:39-1733(+)
MSQLHGHVSLSVIGRPVDVKPGTPSFAALPSVPVPPVALPADHVFSRADLGRGDGSAVLLDLSHLSPESREICRWIEGALQRHHTALLKAYSPPRLEEEVADDERQARTLSSSSQPDKGTTTFAKRERRKAITDPHRRKSKVLIQDIIARESDKIVPKSEPQCLRRFVTSSAFERLSAALLVLNTMFLGVQVELSFLPEMPTSVQVIDVMLAAFFGVEVCLRVWAYKCKQFFCGPGRNWNIFDAIVVTLSALETVISYLVPTTAESSTVSNIGIIRIVRVFRLIRLLRIMRVLRFFKDVRILMLAVAHTMGTAAWAFLLTFMCMYMFGIAITQMVADYVKEQKALGNNIDRNSELVQHFSSMAMASLTLFMSIAGGLSWEVVAHALGKINPLAEALFIGYIMFTAFCMLNVIIGIFCKNAVEVFENDKEKMIEAQLNEKSRYMDNLAGMFNAWDTSGDGYITLEEFKEHLQNPQMEAFLESMGVKPRDALRLFEMMDLEDGRRDSQVDLDGFVTGCLTLQSNAKAVHMEQMLLSIKLLEEKICTIHRQVVCMTQHFQIKTRPTG